MNMEQLSGSSYYDDEDQVSVRSDPPLIYEMQAGSNTSGQMKSPLTQNANVLTIDLSQDGTSQQPSIPKHSPINIVDGSIGAGVKDSNQSFKFAGAAGSSAEEKKSQQPGSSKSGHRTSSRASAGGKPPLIVKRKEKPVAGQLDVKPKLNDAVENIKKEKANRKESPVFTGSKYETDLKTVKVSDILQGDFAPIDIPMIEIPGSRPLVYVEPNVLLSEVYQKDEFFVDELEEEFLMFTAEMQDRTIRRQDGPHQTLRWRKKCRQYLTRGPIKIEEDQNQNNETENQPILDGVDAPKNEETEIVTVQVPADESEKRGAPQVQYQEVILETQVAMVGEKITELPFCDSDYEEVLNPSASQQLLMDKAKQIADEDSNGLVVATTEAFFEKIADEFVIEKEIENESILQIDVLRPVKETLDQVFVKEYESTWINDLKRYETLGKQEKKKKKQKKEEVAASDDDEIADLKEESIEGSQKQDGGESIDVVEELSEDAAAGGKHQESAYSIDEFQEESMPTEGGILATDGAKDSIDDDMVGSEVDKQGSQANDNVSIEVEEEPIDGKTSQEFVEEEMVDDVEQIGDENDEIALQASIEMSQPQFDSHRGTPVRALIAGAQDIDSDSKEGDEQIREAYGDGTSSMPELPHSSSIADARLGAAGQTKAEQKYLSEQDVVSESGGLNQGSIDQSESRVSLAQTKKRKVSKSRKKINQSALSVQNRDEQDFARMREEHNQSLGKNNSSMQIRRPQPPKLLKKVSKTKNSSTMQRSSIDQDQSSQQSKPKNPPVPRFKHPPIDPTKSAEPVLNEKPARKPRPPAVPDNLRASAQSPTPAQQLRESIDHSSTLSKKPPVPKVAEILPGVKIVKPSEQQAPQVGSMSPTLSSSLKQPKAGQPTSSLKKFVTTSSPSSLKKKPEVPAKAAAALQKQLKLQQTPSMANIPKEATTQATPIPHQASASPKGKYKFSKSPKHSPRGGSLKPTMNTLAKYKNVNSIYAGHRAVKVNNLRTPEEIAEKYGNFKMIRPSRQEALLRLTLQQERQQKQVEDQLLARSSHAEQQSTSRSPGAPNGGGSTERGGQQSLAAGQEMLPLMAYNSKAPYEQHLVAQLMDAYRARPEKNRPPQNRLYNRHGSKVRERSIQMPSIQKVATTDFSEEGADEDRYTDPDDEEESIERRPFQLVDNDAYSSIENGSKKFGMAGAPYATAYKSTHMSGFTGRHNRANIDTDLAALESSKTRQNQQSRNLGNQLSTGKQSSSVILNPAEMKGVKVQSPFSPTTYTRLVDIQNKAKKFEESISGMRSRAQNQKKTQTNNSRVSNSLQRDMGGSEFFSKQPSNQTFHPNDRKASQGAIIKVNPSWTNIGNRKTTIDVVDKSTIFGLLYQNSSQFLHKEKAHIDGFRKAQSIQKKNLDWMASKTANSMGLIPALTGAASANAGSSGNFTQRHLSQHKSYQAPGASNIPKYYNRAIPTATDKQGNSNMPTSAVNNKNNFFNTYAVMEEYGNSMGEDSSRHQSSGKHPPRHIPQMAATNQTDFKIFSMKQKKLQVQPDDNEQYSSHLPGVGSKDHAHHDKLNSAQAGIPALQSVRQRGQQAELDKPSTNRSNFFPSFDSRGNMGITQDSNEFQSPYRQRKSNMVVNMATPLGNTNDQPEKRSDSRTSNLPSLQPHSRSTSVNNQPGGNRSQQASQQLV